MGQLGNVKPGAPHWNICIPFAVRPMGVKAPSTGVSCRSFVRNGTVQESDEEKVGVRANNKGLRSSMELDTRN